MSSLTQTKEERREYRRDYFNSLIIKLYFSSQPTYDKNKFVEVLLNYMFMMPSLERSVKKRMFLSSEGRVQFNQQRFTTIWKNLQLGMTMDNHEQLTDLLDGMRDMKEAQYKQLSWVFK